ncbi:hypothetical protein PL11201_530149 [Planktothrix sp. PCC 11201]|uniref:hypothetical protein n=1 Tax=Planktothrix sp. PCC 11201 TaxID=1729650 RepID=UPI000914794D|nr:hypothetical protein [Planktothrix sp. PCC 11201]SKB13819.1 hypothetical protein PL11201_530149 [Planktothrix sp. PCC 11201]
MINGYRQKLVVVFGLLIIIFEDNGQWVEVCGTPYFCFDNSPDYDDLWDELDELLDQPNTNPQSKSQTEIDYDEF